MDTSPVVDHLHTVLAHGAPAGGAPVEDLIPAIIVGVLALAGFGLFAWAHRTCSAAPAPMPGSPPSNDRPRNSPCHGTAPNE